MNRARIRYRESQKAQMWDRWQRGESLHQIARLFDRHHSSVRGILAEAGGIRPSPRHRSERTLSLAEREEISRGVVSGQSIRSIATELGRSPSTVSRELRRNGGSKGYRASRADQAAWDRARRPRLVSWHGIEPWRGRSRPSCNGAGRHSRLPVGSSASIPTR